jgi:hypothetical protein
MYFLLTRREDERNQGCFNNNPGLRGFAFGGILVRTTGVALIDANLSLEIEVTIPAARHG